MQSRVQIKVSKHKWLAGGVVFVNQVPKSAAVKIQEGTKGVGEESLAARHGDMIGHERLEGDGHICILLVATTILHEMSMSMI